jgi:hypothetical protein
VGDSGYLNLLYVAVVDFALAIFLPLYLCDWLHCSASWFRKSLTNTVNLKRVEDVRAALLVLR